MKEPAPNGPQETRFSFDRVLGAVVEHLMVEEREHLVRNIRRNIGTTGLVVLIYSGVIVMLMRPVLNWVTPGNLPERPWVTWMTVGLLLVLSIWSMDYYLKVLTRIADSASGKVVTVLLPAAFGALIVLAFARPGSQVFPLAVGATCIAGKAIQIRWHLGLTLTKLSDRARIHFREVGIVFLIIAVLAGILGGVLHHFRLLNSGTRPIVARGREVAEIVKDRGDAVAQEIMTHIQEIDAQVSALEEGVVGLFLVLVFVFFGNALWRIIQQSGGQGRVLLLDDLEHSYRDLGEGVRKT
jgi:hypothetical protein